MGNTAHRHLKTVCGWETFPPGVALFQDRTEMEKSADTADISVLFLWAVLIFWLTN